MKPLSCPFSATGCIFSLFAVLYVRTKGHEDGRKGQRTKEERNNGMNEGTKEPRKEPMKEPRNEGRKGEYNCTQSFSYRCSYAVTRERDTTEPFHECNNPPQHKVQALCRRKTRVRLCKRLIRKYFFCSHSYVRHGVSDTNFSLEILFLM